MKAEHLIAKLEIKNSIKPDTLNISIDGIADNSVNVRKNYIFVAIHGFYSDGSDYISEAIEKGACLIVRERIYVICLFPIFKLITAGKWNLFYTLLKLLSIN